MGDVIFYRSTWHRGTPVAQGALRLVQNMTLKKPPATGSVSYTVAGRGRFIARVTALKN